MTATTKKNATTHLAAGAVSGFVSCIALQPFDLIKTRMQQPNYAAQPNSVATNGLISRSTLIATTRNVVATDGVLGLWRGTWPTIIRNVPGMAMYFGTLNQVRTAITAFEQQLGRHDALPQNGQKPQLSNTANLVSGATSRAAVGFIMMPITTLKVRFESSYYSKAYSAGIWSATRQLVSKEGVRGLFAGAVPTAIRDAPYAGVYVLCYEKCKLLLRSLPAAKGDSLLSSTVTQNMTAGILAGGLATVLTQPFDMLKTRMQLQPAQYGSGSSNGVFRAFVKIWRDDGFMGFFRGSSLRIMRKGLSAAISWTMYEELVRIIEDRRIRHASHTEALAAN
ncbi:mitochondrial carrier [Ramicandelaber brevisporus]|nr:mitochondrial carrier [Ramicandelaber brevisporus]